MNLKDKKWILLNDDKVQDEILNEKNKSTKNVQN